MTAPVIRPAAPSDLNAITAIYAFEVLQRTGTFEMTPPDLAEMTRRYDALVGGGFPYLVAEHDGAVLGYAYAGAYRLRPAYRYTVENSIYLAESAQRRGVGSALLAQLIADSTSRGFRQMIAVIGDSANAGSVGVHRKAGFTMIGTHPDVGFKFGRWLDIVLMQLALGEGAETPPK